MRKYLELQKCSKHLMAMGSIVLMTACATTGPQSGDIDVSGPSYADISAQTEFSECRSEALSLDASAREQSSNAQYLQAAQTIDRCLLEIDNRRGLVPQQERMRLHALSVMQYFKAGDLTSASDQLEAFELVYKGRDLYFSDNTSFIDTFHLLLSKTHPGAADRHSLLNASEALKTEIRRQRYWQKN